MISRRKLTRKLTDEDKTRLEACQQLTAISEGIALHELERDRAAELLHTVIKELEPK